MSKSFTDPVNPFHPPQSYHGNACRWWHFYPDETARDLRLKFEEIMAGKQEDGLVNGLAKGAKAAQKKWLGKVIW